MPNTAYRTSEANSVYRPAWGGRPARLAYAIISGISRPQIVNPAIMSPENHARS